MVIGCYETTDGYQLSGCGQGVDGECSGQLTQLLSRFIYCRAAHMLSLELLSKDIPENLSNKDTFSFPESDFLLSHLTPEIRKPLSAVQLVSK